MMHSRYVPDALVQEASRFSVATLHEAADGAGALPASIKPLDPSTRLYGRAFPVCCPTGHNLHLHHAVARAEPGAVLVVDTGTGPDFGYWGEVLSEAAVARGLGGLVIAGGVRDKRETLAIGFPVFAAALCVRGTGKTRTGGTVGEPVMIDGVRVAPGDLVAGDVDGVVVLGASTIGQVVERAAQREAKERDIIARLRAGATTVEIYGFEATLDA